MSEISLGEREKIFNRQSPIFECYMSVMKPLVFPEEQYQLSDKVMNYIFSNGREIPSDEDFKEPENFKKVEDIFASSEKFEELKQSFKQIFNRKKGKNKFTKKEKEVFFKWHGLNNGKPFYETPGNKEYTSNFIDKIFNKLKEPENFNFFPKEAKELARL